MNEDELLINDDDESYFDLGESNHQEEDEMQFMDESNDENQLDPDEDSNDSVTSYELELSRSYDDILRSSSLNEVVQIVIAANPVNTNSVIISEKVKEFLHLDGKTRIVHNYSTGLLSAAAVESDIEGDEIGELNERREKEVKDLIWRFIKYLAERDLSQDSVTNRRRKMRHIPALIIYLFSNKMYGLLIGCPYLPEDYQKQVSNALNKINESKHALVDELVKMYRDVGSNKLADRVKELDLAIFDKEPAELRSSTEFRDIDIKDSDIAIYKVIRNRYVNISKSITQEVASDLIEVVVDKDAGIYEKLKDKVRTESIVEVKALLKQFAEESIATRDKDAMKSILFK